MSSWVEGYIVLECRGEYWARSSDLVITALMVVSFKGISLYIDEPVSQKRVMQESPTFEGLVKRDDPAKDPELEGEP